MRAHRQLAAAELRSAGVTLGGDPATTATSWDDSRRKRLLFRDCLKCRTVICNNTTTPCRPNIPGTAQLFTWTTRSKHNRRNSKTRACAARKQALTMLLVNNKLQ